MQPITVRAGQTIMLETRVEGEPTCDVAWCGPDGSELRGSKVKAEYENYRAKLQVRGADRSNSGTYTIRASNVNGEANETVKVTVIDKVGRGASNV